MVASSQLCARPVQPRAPRVLAGAAELTPGGDRAPATRPLHDESYAGTSESGFRNEVQAEEAIARGEKLGDLMVNHDHHRLIGPAAEEVEARLAEFERNVQFPLQGLHGRQARETRHLLRQRSGLQVAWSEGNRSRHPLPMTAC